MNIFSIDKGESQTWEVQFVVAAGGAATIQRGTPTKCVTADGSVAGAVIPMVDGDGLVTAQRFTGLAKDNSTDTASVAGIVNTWNPISGLLYRGSPKVAGSVNTQAKINALMGKKVLFDLTSTVWTVDTAATDALVNCVVIVGGIPAADEVLFMYSPKGTILDTSTGI
uniref:Uncharacterized protein n=1 Tax=uncultured marine virus TaxID=186617 RepID=A0A0F7L8V2_9VIRU|nr:hypothetical protein [uncultured marine virus]